MHCSSLEMCDPPKKCYKTTQPNLIFIFENIYHTLGMVGQKFVSSHSSTKLTEFQNFTEFADLNKNYTKMVQ